MKCQHFEKKLLADPRIPPFNPTLSSSCVRLTNVLERVKDLHLSNTARSCWQSLQGEAPYLIINLHISFHDKDSRSHLGSSLRLWPSHMAEDCGLCNILLCRCSLNPTSFIAVITHQSSLKKLDAPASIILLFASGGVKVSIRPPALGSFS